MNGSRALDAPLFDDDINAAPPEYLEDYDRYLDDVAANLDTPTVMRRKSGIELAEIGQQKARTNPMTLAYTLELENAIHTLAKSGLSFTADHATVIAGNPPNSKITGSVFAYMIRQGEIEAVGYTKATRASSHGRVLRSYRGARSSDRGKR